MSKNFEQYQEDLEVLAPEYEVGKATGEESGRWADKLATREEIIKYLRTAERYGQEKTEESA